MKQETKTKQAYNESAYDRIYLVVEKGRKAEIEKAAKHSGMSLNAFSGRAIFERVNNEEAKAITINDIVDYLKNRERTLSLICAVMEKREYMTETEVLDTIADIIAESHTRY